MGIVHPATVSDWLLEQQHQELPAIYCPSPAAQADLAMAALLRGPVDGVLFSKSSGVRIMSEDADLDRLADDALSIAFELDSERDWFRMATVHDSVALAGVTATKATLL
jgi:hypothetical protein